MQLIKLFFPQVYIFPVSYPNNDQKVQNIILVASKSNTPLSFESQDPELNKYLKHLWRGVITTDIPILTDDYAPVDYYLGKAI